MKIIEANHKTVASLLKKPVEEHWLEDKDAWLKFTDGSTVCIHALNPSWQTWVNLQVCERGNYPQFVDSTDNHLCFSDNSNEQLFTSRAVSLYFDSVHYYISDNLEYVTRKYTPIIEIHYYEEGEPIGGYNS